MAPQQSTVVPWLFESRTPDSLFGRPTNLLPNYFRKARNYYVIGLFIQCFFDFLGIGLAGGRGIIGRLAAGMHAACFVFALIGIYGGVKLRLDAIIGSTGFLVMVSSVFLLFLVINVAVVKSRTGTEDSLVALVFISLIPDFLSAIMAFIFAKRFHNFKKITIQQHAAGDAHADIVSAPEVPSPNPLQVSSHAAVASHDVALAVLPPSKPVQNWPPGSASPMNPVSHQNSHELCAICIERPRNSALYPCGHRMCHQCCTELQRSTRLCPFCRCKINDAIHLY